MNNKVSHGQDLQLRLQSFICGDGKLLAASGAEWWTGEILTSPGRYRTGCGSGSAITRLKALQIRLSISTTFISVVMLVIYTSYACVVCWQRSCLGLHLWHEVFPQTRPSTWFSVLMSRVFSVRQRLCPDSFYSGHNHKAANPGFTSSNIQLQHCWQTPKWGAHANSRLTSLSTAGTQNWF